MIGSPLSQFESHAFPQKTPLGRLRFLEVYAAFDGPKLFACENASGQKFLAFWLGDDQGRDRWLYLPLSASRLQRLRRNELDLRGACLEAEDGFVWIVEAGPDDLHDPVSSIRDVERIDPSWLPAPETFLQPPAEK